MTCHAGYRACLQHRQGFRLGNRNAIDGIYYYLILRQIERKRRVAQEGIVEMVHRDIGAGSRAIAAHQIVLSQTVCFAHRDRLAVYQTEHSVDEGAVDILVIQGGNGTGGAIEGYCAAFIVEQRIFSDVGLESVERHDIAGGSYPERQVGIAEIGKIVEFQNRFVRYLGRIAMSGIIHDEGSRSLLLLDDLGCLGIGIARRGGFAGIGIPHHLLDEIGGIGGEHIICHLIGILHVEVAVSVIAHKHQGVLPGAYIGILSITDGLVYQHLGFFCIGYREAAYGYILQFAARIQSGSLAEHTEPAVADEAGYGAEGVFTLKAQQVIVWIQDSATGGKHAVIPYAVAEEQEIFRHICLALRLIGKHAQVAAVGVGIGGTARKFVIEFISRHNRNAQSVVLFMKFFQPLSLFQQFL